MALVVALVCGLSDQRPMPELETLPPIADQVPWSDHVTDYDRAHFSVYVRLLDAEHLGASDSEMCRAILGLDPDSAGSRAALESHLRRARWMSEAGYRDLLPNERSPGNGAP